jgi:hypothetical protein
VSYRCPDCGTRYESDPGHCGQNVPYVCRATLVEFDDNAAVVAALRLADCGAGDAESFRRVARRLLEKAPETSPTDTFGPALLVEMIRAGRLVAVVNEGRARV